MARTKVQAELIATNAISGTIIADNAITATHIATNSISGTLVQDGGIVTTMIAANNVTSTKIVTDAIQTRHIADDQVTGDKLTNNISIAGTLASAGDFTVEGDGTEIFLKSADHTVARIIPRGTGGDLDKGLLSLFDAGTEDIRIDSGGNTWIDTGYNVGIGTTSPDNTFHIHDGSAGSVSAYADSHLIVETDQSSNFISMLSPAGANQGILFGDADANWRGQIQYNHNIDTMYFWTAAAVAGQINSNGDVAIGPTAPKTFQSGFENLQIGNQLVLNIDSVGAGAGVYMGNNVYRDNTDSRWEYIHTDEASQLVQANGQFDFRNTASGSANAAITWATPLKILVDGNIDAGSGNTTALRVPNGTTAQQPTGATGMMRYNSTNSKIEAYVGSAWENVDTTSQSLTGITGLDLWADVTGGISSTTVADLSGNSRTGTLSSTSHSGTLSGNTYMHFNDTGEYLSYGDGSNIPNYSGDVTFFFVVTNTTGFSTYRTLLGDSSGAQGYQIIRTYGSTDDWNFYYKSGNDTVTSTNTALNSNGSINTTQILIFSFASNGSGTIYKRTGGSEGSDSFGALSSFTQWAFTDNTSSTFYIGNSSWAGEHYDGGIFAWGIIDHEITSAEKTVIYDWYAGKGIGN